jgi:hypothetical protein
MTVFGTFDPSPTESWMVYNCAKSWSASTIYRSLPESVMATATSSSDGGPGMITGAPELNNTDGEGSTAEESESPKSQAWIAGVVIGCVAAGGAVAGLGFWLGRRRKRGRGGEDPQNGFDLHSSTLLRSGGQPGGQPGGEYSPPPEDNTKNPMPHGQAVTVADGVEMDGGYGGYYSHYREKGPPISLHEAPGGMSIELAAEPVRKKKPYV